MKALVVLGTRPQIIKMGPVIIEMTKRPEIDLRVVHTGQHYDKELSANFFKELELPEPDVYLNVGSFSHGKQTGLMLERIEAVIKKEKPDVVIVTGDSNTTLAGALAAIKLKIPVAHVEAGCRTFDLSTPEEVNRVCVDAISQFLFAPTEKAAINLINEGIDPDRIFITGNPLIEACIKYAKLAEYKSKILGKLGLKPHSFYLTTIHRAENVDYYETLKELVDTLLELNKPVVFPIHPRTKKMLKTFGLLKILEKDENIIIVPPLPYLDFLKLLNNCLLVLSDSGSIQQECIALNRLCVRLKSIVSVPEALEYPGIRTTSASKREILFAVQELLKIKEKELPKPEIINLNSSKLIANILVDKYRNGEMVVKPYLSRGYYKIKEEIAGHSREGKSVKEVEVSEKKHIIAIINEKKDVIYPHENLKIKSSWILRYKINVIYSNSS